MTPRVVGLDLSLTSTGVAVSDGRLARIRSKGFRLDTIAARAQRIDRIVNDICAATDDFTSVDLVVIEAPAYSSVGGSSHDRSGLWWLTVAAIRAHAVEVVEVMPTTRAKYATGKGAGPDASKDACLAAVVRRFPTWAVTGNDVADALVLCAMGCDHLGAPLAEMPKAHRDALAKVVWPVAS